MEYITKDTKIEKIIIENVNSNSVISHSMILLAVFKKLS